MLDLLAFALQFECIIFTLEDESYSGQLSIIFYCRTISDRAWYVDRLQELLRISKRTFPLQNMFLFMHDNVFSDTIITKH